MAKKPDPLEYILPVLGSISDTILQWRQQSLSNKQTEQEMAQARERFGWDKAAELRNEADWKRAHTPFSELMPLPTSPEIINAHRAATANLTPPSVTANGIEGGDLSPQPFARPMAEIAGRPQTPGEYYAQQGLFPAGMPVNPQLPLSELSQLADLYRQNRPYDPNQDPEVLRERAVLPDKLSARMAELGLEGKNQQDLQRLENAGSERVAGLNALGRGDGGGDSPYSQTGLRYFEEDYASSVDSMAKVLQEPNPLTGERGMTPMDARAQAQLTVLPQMLPRLTQTAPEHVDGMLEGAFFSVLSSPLYNQLTMSLQANPDSKRLPKEQQDLLHQLLIMDQLVTQQEQLLGRKLPHPPLGPDQVVAQDPAQLDPEMQSYLGGNPPTPSPREEVLGGGAAPPTGSTGFAPAMPPKADLRAQFAADPRMQEPLAPPDTNRFDPWNSLLEQLPPPSPREQLLAPPPVPPHPLVPYNPSRRPLIPYSPR